MSLRSRVAALVIAAVAVVLLVIGIVVPALVRDYLMDELDRQLVDAQVVAIPVLNAELDGYGRPTPKGGPTATFAGAFVELRDLDGEVVVSRFVDTDLEDELSPPVLDDGTVLAEGERRTVDSVDGTAPEQWRILQFPAVVERGGEAVGTITIALPTTEVDDTVSRVVRIQWIAGIGGIAVLGVAVWLLAGFGLRPLRRMEHTAAVINDAGDLGRRIEHPGRRTELGRLGHTLNAMLERLQGSFESQQATERRLRRFVADASHELRTPLTSIRGYAELYRRGGDQPDQVARSMERIEDEAVRMGRLVEDLLTLARLDERRDLEQVPIDAASLVTDLVGDARVVDAEREYRLDATPCPVVGDAHRISQAVANLLANARTHTPAGTPVEVTVGPAGPSGGVRIAVADHGRGLGPGEAELVFDRFYRADPSRARPTGGSGLGLAITAAIVHAHGGTIRAEDTPGGGATFVIELPPAPIGVPAAPERVSPA